VACVVQRRDQIFKQKGETTEVHMHTGVVNELADAALLHSTGDRSAV
jgi:hypothetical protein